jgi:hypothetical protein
MSYREEALRVLKESDGNIIDASHEIYGGPESIALYVIQIGLEKLKSQVRRDNRREIKREIQPEFVKGKVTGSVVPSKAFQKRIIKNTQRLFSNEEGWMIGDINIGMMTREQLFAQAVAERKSAKGCLQNAQFYEALAEPLQPGQRADAYWKPETATKIKRDIWKENKDRRPELR